MHDNVTVSLEELQPIWLMRQVEINCSWNYYFSSVTIALIIAKFGQIMGKIMRGQFLKYWKNLL